MGWTAEKLEDAERMVHALAKARSAESLESFHAHCVIDCSPQPTRFDRVCRPFQADRIRRLGKAIERACGHQNGYTGPGGLWSTYPRGHDKTTELARHCLWAVCFAKRPISGVWAAQDQQQARLSTEKAVTLARLNTWIPAVVTADKIAGPMGVVKVVANDAAGSYGLTDNLIVLDELTWWKSSAMYDAVASGWVKVPDAALLVITNAGVIDSWQWHVMQSWKSRPEFFDVYEQPVGEWPADWMTREKAMAVGETMSPGTMKRVFFNQWINQNELSLLTPEEIIACEDRGTLWEDDFIPNYRPELYIGVDVGRTRDLTVIWVLEMVGDVAWTREVVTMQGASFDWQRGEIRRRIMDRGVVKCCIDKGGIGTQLAEELTTEFPYIVEGVALNEGTQGRVALRVREQFRGNRIRIPVDSVIRADFQQVSDVGVGTAGLPKIRTGRTELGHADRFWAMALAVEALPVVGKPVCRSLPVAVRSIHATKRGR